MSMMTNTLGRYFAGRFVVSALGVFAYITGSSVYSRHLPSPYIPGPAQPPPRQPPPPNAIHRGQDGEVFIDDSCIGCGNCQRNCPYGVIRMDSVPPPRPSSSPSVTRTHSTPSTPRPTPPTRISDRPSRGR